MSQYFPPYENSGKSIKVELDLSNYVTKSDLKDITHVDTSSFALKTNLAALKTEIDKIDTENPLVPDNFRKYRIKHNLKINIFLVLNKKLGLCFIMYRH